LETGTGCGRDLEAETGFAEVIYSSKKAKAKRHRIGKLSLKKTKRLND
jgi:hypothetical protein